MTYSNNGPDAAANVTRTVTLPAGVTGVTTTGTVSGSTITYPTLTTLASGGTNTFTFSYTTPTTGSTITTTSTVSTSTSQGSNTGPNTATVTTVLTGAADVTATIAPTTGTAPVGSNVSFLPVIKCLVQIKRTMMSCQLPVIERKS